MCLALFSSSDRGLFHILHLYQRNELHPIGGACANADDVLKMSETHLFGISLWIQPIIRLRFRVPIIECAILNAFKSAKSEPVPHFFAPMQMTCGSLFIRSSDSGWSESGWSESIGSVFELVSVFGVALCDACPAEWMISLMSEMNLYTNKQISRILMHFGMFYVKFIGLQSCWWQRYHTSYDIITVMIYLLYDMSS